MTISAATKSRPDAIAGKDPFRVLFASPTGEMGGAEQVILSLAERLPAHGIQASIALLKPGPLEKIIADHGVAVHVFPEQYRYRDMGSVQRCVRWLAGCIREQRADILHSNLTAHFVGSWAARRAKVPELWHLHDYPFHFDIVHAISQRLPTDMALFTTEFLKSGEPRLARHANAVVHPDCVDVEKLRLVPRDPGVRARLGLGSAPFFMTVTRLQEHKGHTYLIDAAAKIAAEFPDVTWVIAGKAKGEEQEAYLKGLQEQVAAKGLAKRILFLGYVLDDDLAALRGEATALVHPAITEGYGLVLLEAMASDLLVITAAATGPTEIIENEKNGLMVPVRDSDALAGAMRRVLANPDLAADLRRQASVDVRRKSVDIMVEETILVYRKLLAAR